MAELFELVPPSGSLDPVESVVNKLKSLLQRAETGELRGFAYTAEYCRHPNTSRDKGTEWGHYGESFNASAIGGLEIVKLSILEYAVEFSETQESETARITEPPEDPAG